MSIDNRLKNKYYIKLTDSSPWYDITDLFTGVKVLSIEGFEDIGEAVNVYTSQWNDSNVEDFMITGGNSCHSGEVIRKNVTLSLTFICGERYGALNTRATHDQFISNITSSDFYINSLYTGKTAHVVCLESYSPTQVKLHRGNNSYIMGTVRLHCLQPPYPQTI